MSHQTLTTLVLEPEDRVPPTDPCAPKASLVPLVAKFSLICTAAILAPQALVSAVLIICSFAVFFLGRDSAGSPQ